MGSDANLRQIVSDPGDFRRVRELLAVGKTSPTSRHRSIGSRGKKQFSSYTVTAQSSKPEVALFI